MRIQIFIFIIILTGCTNRQTDINYEQILDVAEVRHHQGESLSEDVLLREALKYYQTLEPVDSTRLLQATILTAYHYWWNNEKEKVEQLSEEIINEAKEKGNIASDDQEPLAAVYLNKVFMYNNTDYV